MKNRPKYGREVQDDDNFCRYCGAKENLSLDHLISRSKGGPDIPDNAVLACRKGNSSKGEKWVY